MSSIQDAFARSTELCLDGRIIRESIFPTESGGYSDVYEGLIENRKVAIKILRPFKLGREKLFRRLWREYLAWSRLSHPNILACLGYSYDFSSGPYTLPSLISPWMENGTVIQYLETHPDADRIKLLVGIADGLSYLHARNPVIIHGDLRAGNVLVSDGGIPCLTDFGLSRVLEEVKGMTTTSEVAGSVRWMSPELFRKDGKISTHSDVWAYGMTILEILTGERPYSEERHDVVVLGLLFKDGEIPSRPEKANILKFDDRMWGICKRCWSAEPTTRPSMREVVILINPPANEVTVVTERSENTLVSGKINTTNTFPMHAGPIFNHKDVVRCFNFSVGGKYLAVGIRHTVEIYDTSTGSQSLILSSHTPGYISSLCFSPDGKVLANGDTDGNLWVWNIADQERRSLNKHQSDIYAVEFSSDGRFLLSAGGLRGTVQISNMDTYEGSELPMGANGSVTTWSRTVAFTPDGHLVAVAHNQYVYLWDAQKNVLLEQLMGHTGIVTCVAFAPDGKGLVSGTANGNLKFWNLSPFLSSSRNEALEMSLYASKWLSDGKGRQGSMCVADITYQGEVLLLVAVSKVGQLAISCSDAGYVRFWDSRTRGTMAEFFLGEGPTALSIDLGPTTGMLATVGETKDSTRLWNYSVDNST